MGSLPPEIQDYVRDHVSEVTPAYLRLDSANRIVDLGGDLAALGLGDLQRDRAADEQIEFLHGLLPHEAKTSVLRNIALGEDKVIDVHLHGRWVLFFDTTTEARRARRLHQSVNDLAMMKARVRRLEQRLDAPAAEADAGRAAARLLGGVFRSRAVAVLRYREDGMVDVVGWPPAWFLDVFPDKADFTRLNVWTRFPMLENFLVDAEAFWSSGGDGSIRSGMWYDVNASGREMHLEATATLVERDRVLLVEELGRHYEERQLLIQRAREGKLASARRIVEQEKAAQHLEAARDELEFRVAERTAELTEVVQRLNEEIADRKRAAERLIEYQGRLRSLAVELTRAEEEERRRIAAGLHDYIGQMLALSKMKVATLQRLADEAAGPGLQELRGYLDDVIQYTRTLTFELGSPVLYELGLEAALSGLVDQMNQQHPDTAFSFEDDESEKPLSEAVRVVLFQAAREIFHNAMKHADATKIDVCASRRRGFFELRITDDGKGFDPNTVGPNAGSSSGYGIFSIRERIDGVGGRMDIESAAGKGATITLIAPIEEG